MLIEKNRRMKLKTIGIPALMAVAVCSCHTGSDDTKPKVKPLMEAVYASGFVVTKDEYEIFSQAEGHLSEKLVTDGTLVKKGDPLFVIESGQQSARYQMAKEAFVIASDNYKEGSPVLQELKAAINTARSKNEYDSINFVRYSNLIRSNATTRAEFDRVKLMYENSSNEYTLQKIRLEKIKNQVYLEWQNAKTQLVIASNESGRYLVRSEIDGIVLMTTKDKGELIRRNENLGVVGKKGAFYLQLTIDERDIQRVRSGQGVIVKIDAYPEKTFAAVISKIYPMAERRQQSVRADAELKEPLPGGFSGLALEANIIIRKNEKALVIPKNKLLPGDSLLVRSDNGTKKIKVQTGIETLDEIEITEGLDRNTLLIENN
jgi:HlyD family secretion protein